MALHSANIEYIIAGLGNPGAQYEKTRHNAGFRFLDYLSGKTGIPVERLKHYAKTGRGEIAGKGVLLMQPQTYMNDSGIAIADAARFYKIPTERILVIYDDISLAPGKVRVRREGSAGGHNGIKSIIENLGTEVFPRIKIGVGAKPHPDYDLANWVLGTLGPEDLGAIVANYDKMVEAVSLIIEGSIEKAMQKCN